MLLVLICSTGCRTARIDLADPDRVYREQVAELVPELPELPEFPDLSWQFDQGRYSISESDVDRLLDYRDNQLAEYRFQVEIYADQLRIIIGNMTGSYP